MEVESVGKSVMCLLEDPQGNPLESPMFLPLTFGPQHLLQVVNQLLNNVSFMHIFFFSFVVLMLKTKIVEIQDDMGCSFLICFIYLFFLHFYLSRRRSCHTLSMCQTKNLLCRLVYTWRRIKVSRISRSTLRLCVYMCSLACCKI